MDRIRLGIVGGGFGRYGLAPAFRRDPRWEVAGIAAASIQSAQAYGDMLGISECFGDWRDMIDRLPLDAVAIATPPSVQFEIARACLEVPLAIFAEKPLATTLAQARALTDVAEARGIPNVVDFLFPELDTWRLAKEYLDDARVGSVRHIALEWQFESYANRNRIDSWKTDPAKGGGVLRHFGCHSLHYLEHLLGPICGLYARTSRPQDLPGNGDTFAVMDLEFARGATGAAVLGSAAIHGPGHGVRIYGSEGTLVLMNTTQDPVAGFRLEFALRGEQLKVVASEQPDPDDRTNESRIRPASRIARRFADWILDGPPASPNFRDGSRVQELLDAAQRSEQCRGWITIGTP